LLWVPARLYPIHTSFAAGPDGEARPPVRETSPASDPIERGKVRAMADPEKQKDILTRLSDAGEEALSRVASSQATTKLMDSVGSMRERVEDMQRKVRGLDALEQRVASLEKRVDELSKPKRTTTRSRASTARKTTGTSSPRTSRQTPES
jgi:hypothetical protein